jgi:parvulin-like peptidyl-prolyl isomerase
MACGFVTAAEPSAVAANVGSDSISAGEVAHEMQTALGERKLSPDEAKVLQAQTLGLLVNRQLVMQYLTRLKMAASEAEVDQQVQRLTTELKRRQKTLDEQLETLGLTEAEFRRALAWETSWPKYLQSKMTPENIQKYFAQHRRDFDGTKVRVAHILLKVDTPNDPQAVQAVVDRAGNLREEILAVKLTFAEAAKKHSQAPTAADGGDIGLISRHEPMPEAFSEAAYELQVGQTSEPVLTTFGIHLVHCLAIEPGKLTLADDGVETAVRTDLVRYLFLWVSERQRAETKIEFTGAVPYFDPATGKLVAAD